MNISIKLNKDFERCLEDLKEKYGEDFEYINGLHPSQLDFSEFIDNFVDKDTMADTTIDPNANANHKDIRSFITEKGKSEDKLFVLNKIFIEIKKKWGLRTAKQWLEQEFSRGFYLNDSATASYFPYCFSGDTKILTKNGVRRLDELVGQQIQVLNKNRGWENAVVKNFGIQPLRLLVLERAGVTKEIYATGNHRWFVVRENKSIVEYETDQLQEGMCIPFNTTEEIQDIDWIVQSVTHTDRVEDVYCAVTESGSFTLDNNVLTHNCWANDFTRLATDGLFFLNNYNNQPPKHLTTYFDDVIEFVSFLSNRQSGAVGMPNVLIWAWYFWQKDVKDGYYLKDPETYLRQNFQKFIYRLNQPFLRIDQCSFTNVSIFDRPYLESLFGGIEFPDGEYAIDHIEDLIECQKTFMEVVSETREENMFTFPVLTYSLLYKDKKFQDEDFAKWCSKHNIKWSDSNFFVSDNVGILSNCCRLLSNTTKLDAFINSIGGTALSVGSCRVSTINLVRIAYESKFNKKKYLNILRDRTLLDCKALYSMRHIIKRNIEKGLLPNYQDGALELDKQFCTIGGIGIYEVMDLFGLINTDEFDNKSYSDEAIEFTTEILDTINDVKDNFECDFTFNLEMIPAENCAGVICQADNLLYEQDKYFIYSNQWIPLMEKCTIQEKCRLGSLFDKKCGGGCIAHIDIENRFPNEETAWDILNYVASQGVIYFAFTTKISVCEDKHAFIGSKTCPKCGKPVADQFARVVGFYVPVSSYQKIRKQEFNLRKWYNVLNNDSIM